MAEELTEIDRLRAELESYRQREVDDLRSALAVARQDIVALRAEAQRISTAAQELNILRTEEIAKLRSQLEVKEAVARQLNRHANAGRN
jgi:hypothetical protein